MPQPAGIGSVIKWVVVAFFGFIVYTCSSVMNEADRNSSPSPSASSVPAAPAVPVPPPSPPLELLSWRCEQERSYTHVKGEVRNISSEPLKNILAVGTLRTKQGELVESEDALLDLRTLMPGQKSAFDVMIPDNPLGTKCNLAFKTFRGEALEYKRK